VDWSVIDLPRRKPRRGDPGGVSAVQRDIGARSLVGMHQGALAERAGVNINTAVSMEKRGAEGYCRLVLERTSSAVEIAHGPDIAGMTSQTNQESNMSNQIANTEIRALDDAELDMIAGGNGLFGNIFSTIQKAEKNILSEITQIAQHNSAMAFLGSMDTMSGGPGKSHYSR
jgi:hypothetical protein